MAWSSEGHRISALQVHERTTDAMSLSYADLYYLNQVAVAEITLLIEEGKGNSRRSFLLLG